MHLPSAACAMWLLTAWKFVVGEKMNICARNKGPALRAAYVVVQWTPPTKCEGTTVQVTSASPAMLNVDAPAVPSSDAVAKGL